MSNKLGLTLTSLGNQPPPFTEQGSGCELVVVHGPDEGKRAFLQDEPIGVGTDKECALILTDPTVSRRHCQVSRNPDGAIVLADLGSKNGCFFQGNRFEQAEARIGAEFRAGETIIKLVPREQVLDPLPLDESRFGGLTGNAPAMRKLFAIIEKVAQSSAAVLLEGETGVGKEVVAEEIHRRSARRDKPFVIFDCGAVPDELIESTLFGHVKGAFTGATSDRVGVLAEADGGTVFLDEIGELKIDLQPTLLRVLDRGMVRPIGATSYKQIDVRVISATHRNLGQRIAAGEFREDLYYRLAVVRMAVPALRERAGDVPLLVQHFLNRAGRPDVGVTEEAMTLLTKHGFPGNVRELKNLVERGLALQDGGIITADALLASGGLYAPLSSPTPAAVAATAGRTAPAGPRKPFRDAKAEAIDGFEKQYLSDLMAEFSTVSAAADEAQMDRKHLRTLLRRYGLIQED